MKKSQNNWSSINMSLTAHNTNMESDLRCLFCKLGGKCCHLLVLQLYSSRSAGFTSLVLLWFTVLLGSQMRSRWSLKRVLCLFCGVSKNSCKYIKTSLRSVQLTAGPFIHTQTVWPPVIVLVACLVLDIVIEPIPAAGQGAKWGSTIVLQSLGGLVWWSRRIYVVEGRGRRWWLIPLHTGETLWLINTAAPAQHQSSDETEADWGISKVHGHTNLILPTDGKEGVVDIHYDIAGGPGHGDKAE